MRRFGLSAAVAAAFAAPAWGAPPFLPSDGPPQPAGFTLITNYNVPPDVRTPPIPVPGVPPGGWYGQPGSGPVAPPPGVVPPGVAPPPAEPPQAVAPPAGWSGPAPDACGFAFDPCYPCQRVWYPKVHAESWARADWLYWKFRDVPVPPLLVGGNPALPLAGIPGGGNAVPLVGPTRDLGHFNGVRATFGTWFDPDGELGAEISAFVFAREGTADVFRGGPGRSVSVPLVGTTGAVRAYDFSFPGRVVGEAGVRTASNLWGAEASLLHRWYGNGCLNFDTLFGYRHIELNERIDLFGRAQPAGAIGTFLGATLPPGATVFTSDAVRARTEFHGAQFGARLEARRSMFTVTGYAKGGLGANIQTLRAEGTTTVVGAGPTRTVVGGLRVFPTNFGRDTNTDFAGFADCGLELGLQVTKNVSLRVGYNALWWSDVLRPGNVIGPVATLAQVPIDPTFNAAVRATQPTTAFRSSDFWAHGLVVGMMIDW
jgi:hypothetical protein